MNDAARLLLNDALDRARGYGLMCDKHGIERPADMDAAIDMAVKLLSQRVKIYDTHVALTTYNRLETASDIALSDLYKRLTGIGIGETPRQALERLLDEPLANPFLVAAVYAQYLEESELLQDARAKLGIGDK